jgi:nucleotide-binding universal stress UspA family protein
MDMHRFRRLMVGLARTDADDGLLRYAARVARLGTASEVRFVHVLPVRPGLDVAAESDRARDELRKEVHTHFADVPGTVKLHYDAFEGPLLDRLLRAVADHATDLLLIGHRHDHPGRHALARWLAMKAPCSVWVVPEQSPATFDRLLVPVDFSEHAADALRVATSMVRLAGNDECLALHVYFNAARATYEEYDQVIRGQEGEAYRRFVAPIDGHGVRVTPLFEEGANVAHVIHRVAAQRGCDLVVMASRGRSRSAAILLGSVAEEAIVETRVPLLVVKHYGAQLGLLQALLDKGFRDKPGQQFD